MSANPKFHDFLARLDARFADDSEKMPVSEWIERNTTLRKRPFSFAGFEFQRAIADDMHPNLSCIKCSQIGLTEIQIRKFLAFLKRTTAVNGIFTLPTDAMFKRVSQTRVKTLVDTEAVFNMDDGSPEKPIRSMGLYQIGQSFGFFTGNKEGDATSINADLVFNDEVDLSDQENLTLFNSRLQGSDYRIRQGFSTPSFEGYGIDASYKASDKREYMCRCDRCNHWNIPTFSPKFVDLPGLPPDLNDLTEIDPDIAARIDFDNAFVRCEKCLAPLDLANPKGREWVPENPGALGRGYRVRPFSTNRIGIKYIVQQLLEYKRNNALRGWYNTVLGEPFNDSNARLQASEILAVMKGANKVEMGRVEVIVGIDVGHICHLTMAKVSHGQLVVFRWLQVPATELLDTVRQIKADFNLIAGCIDLHPQSVLAGDVMEASGGAIVPVEYAAPTAPAVTLHHNELDVFTHVRSNRTKILDAVVYAIRKQKVAFVGYGMQETIIVSHLQDMVRIEEPETAAFWNKLTGDDHYFHSLGYLLHSLKIRDVLLLDTEADERVSTLLFGARHTVQQNAAGLGVKFRQKDPSVLGLA